LQFHPSFDDIQIKWKLKYVIVLILI
jgi:hypothetical protein